MNDKENPQDPKDRSKKPINRSEIPGKRPKQDVFDLSSENLPEKDSALDGDSALDRAIGSARRRPVAYQRTQAHLPGEFQSEKDKQDAASENHSPQKRSPLDDTPPPSLGSTPFTPPPALDERGMPLPRRMDEPPSPGRTSPSSVNRTITSTIPVQPQSRLKKWWKANGPGSLSRGQSWGCVMRMVVIGLFVGIILAIIGGSLAVFYYNRIASTLPEVQDLRDQAAQFETTRILDRDGNVLYELVDPNAGKRTYVPLDQISPFLVAATIATEDANFYSHPGYDVMAIARSFYYNLISDQIVSGASTITQQLTKMLLLAPEEQVSRTYTRKLREAILAAEITRQYSKDEILELYLNEINFGNLAYGVEAAAQTYFNTSAKNLLLVKPLSWLDFRSFLQFMIFTPIGM